MGIFSDKIGCKVVVMVCLLLFLVGLLVCFIVNDIVWFVIGRFI